MAVYTNVQKSEVEFLLKNYDLGNFIKIEGIQSGVVNSNYHLYTNKGRYILTIYEQASGSELNDLSYFFNLKKHLSLNGINCPSVLTDNNGNYLNKIQNKPCAIVSFLKGNPVNKINNFHLEELGENIAKMHLASNDFELKRENDFSISKCEKLFLDVKDHIKTIGPYLLDELEHNIDEIKHLYPKELPKSVIHGDLFPDNVFFENNKLVGIIDFYFACDDYCIYDLAICLNAWCFDYHEEFNVTKARKLFTSYNKVKKISEEELNSLPIFTRLSSLRFLLTRIYDWVNHDKNALVKAKNPNEYLKKFNFHKNIKSYKQYGI